jgi:glucose-1-phosphate thymidylyltransferase
MIGPNVAIGENCALTGAILKNSVIDDGSTITDVMLENSLVGKGSSVTGSFVRTTLADYDERRIHCAFDETS